MATTAVSAATAATQPAATNNAAAKTDESKSEGAITADFETFLKLLTTQLTNQDPLNPLDSTEFVAQIAQFSGVEQQVQTNDKLGRIESLLTGGSALTEWLGAEVEAPAALRFDEDPLALNFEADPDATSALLLVSDAEGKVIDARTLQTGVGNIEWDGELATGGSAEPGIYSFRVQQSFSDSETTTVTPTGFAKVVEARVGSSGGVDLILEGGDTVASSDVAAARDASG